MRFRSYRTALRVDSIHVACRLLTRALCLSRVWDMEPLKFFWEPQSSVYHVCCGMPWACALAEKNVNMTVIIILVLIIFFCKGSFLSPNNRGSSPKNCVYRHSMALLGMIGFYGEDYSRLTRSTADLPGFRPFSRRVGRICCLLNVLLSTFATLLVFGVERNILIYSNLSKTSR